MPHKKGCNDEKNKIQTELEALKKELKETKRKLKRMQGLKTKKIRFLVLSLAILLAIIIISALAVNRIFFVKKGVEQARMASMSGARYAIQVATYNNAIDAEHFSLDLNSKGYNTFIDELRYKKERPRFIVYIGIFEDKKSAATMQDKLKRREGLTDSIIVLLQKQE